jgi:hypothetical protein
MKRRLPSENASANLCGLVAIIRGFKKRKENRKQTLEPARQAKNPRNLKRDMNEFTDLAYKANAKRTSPIDSSLDMPLLRYSVLHCVEEHSR